MIAASTHGVVRFLYWGLGCCTGDTEGQLQSQRCTEVSITEHAGNVQTGLPWTNLPSHTLWQPDSILGVTQKPRLLGHGGASSADVAGPVAFGGRKQSEQLCAAPGEVARHSGAADDEIVGALSRDDLSGIGSNGEACNGEEDIAVLEQVVITAARELPGGALTSWQAAWCKPDVVRSYLRARRGDVAPAARLLARALQWRHEHRDILTGARLPRWQGDMRVLARGEHGHPIIFMSMQHQCSKLRTADCIDHLAAVLEAALSTTRQGAGQFDIVCDCRGFTVWKSLDLRPTLGAAEMLRYPYRGRLRLGLIVDAPAAFSIAWRMALNAIPLATRKKIRFVSSAQAVAILRSVAGTLAAEVVEQALASNSAGGGGALPYKLPSEIDDEPAQEGGPTVIET